MSDRSATPGAEEPAAPTRFEPPASDVGAPFWDATRRGELLLPWCTACERPHWYPRRRCPHCRSGAIVWRPSPGSATVHAVSVQHRPQWPGLVERAPYAVAVLELDEGVRMLGEVVGAPVDDLEVGQRVELAWEDLSDGRRLPVFTPVSTLAGAGRDQPAGGGATDPTGQGSRR